MFKIIWDKSTGGVLLSSQVFKETLGYSPRPVFFEELDLLGIDKLGWEYPRCPEPIMWAINKQYWYRGDLLFEAKGANIYDTPTIIIAKGIKPSVLNAIDVQTMLEKNADKLFLIESEAVEFIRDVYTTYSKVNQAHNTIQANHDIDFEALAEKIEKKSKKKMAVVKEDCDSFDVVPLDIAKKTGKQVLLSTKIDRFIASFSGGKDSQVVLDLCTKAIPPTEFEVIYSDTGYELPPSLLLYEEVQLYYHKRFPTLKFSTTRNHESVLNYWDKIGTPSDTHRWCCSVMKTAPLYRSLKVEGNKQARVLAFDGVRAEESTRRSTYNRIGKGVKHSTVINSSPILAWNSTEIFLYLFKYKLPLNPGYRYGITRVGCLICPFSSEWNDMVVNNCYNASLKPFLAKIESHVEKLLIPDPQNYIASGNWKRRAGGRNMTPYAFLNVVSSRPHLIVEIKHNCKNLTTWFGAIGEFSGNQEQGSIRYKESVYSYKIERHNDRILITFPQSFINPIFQSLIKRALYKSTFCINCEACEVECPTGALSIIPNAKIDISKCIHCHKCLNFHELGCIAAHSLKTTILNSSKMKLVGYNNFGMKDEWLDYFMSNYNTYFENNDHGLNLKEQLPSFIKWLVHAEILTDVKEKKVTPIGKELIKIYADNPNLVWEIIWINLTYNAPIVKWYCRSVPFFKEIKEMELRGMVKNDYPDISDTTIKNIVYALARTLRESPIGEELSQYMVTGKLTFVRKPYLDISREALAYSIYRYGELYNISEFRVSTLLSEAENGPKVEFGIDHTIFLKQLRSLHIDGILVAELNMGLDHITLREDLNTISVLELLTK